jgi:hypothetical protein
MDNYQPSDIIEIMAELLENISLTRVLDPALCEKQRRELPASQMGYFAW